MNRPSEWPLDRRLRLAGILVVLGLIIEAWTLVWNSPIGFLIFLGVGGLLIAAGIVIYLLALISPAVTGVRGAASAD